MKTAFDCTIPRLRIGRHSGLLLACFACGFLTFGCGDERGELPMSAAGPAAEDDSAQDATARADDEVLSSAGAGGVDSEGSEARSVDAYRDALGVSSSADYQPPADLDALLEEADFVVIGVIDGVTEGRKEYAGRGCSDSQDEYGRCAAGAENDLLYTSYVDLVIESSDVLKGQLPAPQSSVHLEHPWPNDHEVDMLTAVVPLGARIVLAGRLSPDPEGQIGPLEEAGVYSASELADNLLDAAPYGVVIETDQGVAALPWAGRDVTLGALIDSDSSADLDSFDRLVEEIESRLR